MTPSTLQTSTILSSAVSTHTSIANAPVVSGAALSLEGVFNGTATNLTSSSNVTSLNHTPSGNTASPGGGSSSDIHLPAVANAAIIETQNVQIVQSVLTTMGLITSTACGAGGAAAFQGHVVTAALLCVLPLIVTFAAALTTLWKALSPRESTDLAQSSGFIHLYPGIENHPTIQQLEGNFTNQPLLVGYHNCTDPSCHNLYYSNRVSPDPQVNIIHQLSTTPRGAANNDKLRVRYDENGHDGNVYGHYEFHNKNRGTDGLFSEDPDFPQNLADVANQKTFAHQGAWCFNIEDGTDNRNYASTGYLVVQQGGITIPNQDGESDAWLGQCNALPPTKRI